MAPSDILLCLVAVAVCIRAVRALLGKLRAPQALEVWRRNGIAQGSRVLLVSVSPTHDALVDLARELVANGASLAQESTLVDLAHFEEESFDVVIVDDLLRTLPADEAKAALHRLCALVPTGGAVLVRNWAVLPNSCFWVLHAVVEMKIYLWNIVINHVGEVSAPYDVAQWAPRTANVESRISAGPLHEALVFRRVADPSAAVDRLRRMHGDTSMAYCTAPSANRVGRPEDDMRYFLAKEGDVEIGYVAYMEHVLYGARLRLVLMDPVCAPEHREATVRPFLAECQAVQSRPLFSCVSSDWKDALAALGLSTTMLGSEVGISLKDYKLSKERRRYIRAAPAKGLEVHRECFDLAELEELNRAWVGSKASGTEVQIWTWPPSMPECEAGSDDGESNDESKRLFCYQDGKLVGFVVAEPYYRGDGSEEVLGYGLNTIRFLPQLSPPWISDFTVASLVQELKAENTAKYLAFGLSPFCDVGPREGEVTWLRCLHQVAWKANLESIYSIQGLAKKKAHHCAGQGVPLHDRYIASPAEGLDQVGDATRFVLLLLGDNLWKVPEALASLSVTLTGDAITVIRRTVKSAWTLLSEFSFRRQKTRRQTRRCTTTRRKTFKCKTMIPLAKAHAMHPEAQ